MTAPHGSADARMPHVRGEGSGMPDRSGLTLDRRGLLRGAAAAGTLGLGLAAGLSTTPPAQAAGTPTALDPKDFTLESHGTKTLDLADALLKEAGSADIADVMKAANHDRTEASVISGQVHGFVWDDSEQKEADCFPQGITSTRDAVGTKDNGRYQDHQLLAVSFYDKDPESSRINLVDWDASRPNKYRRVLLVEPTGPVEKPDFEDVTVHVGGIAWYGDLLYVADTGAGMRVFDMTRILKTDTGGDYEKVGRDGDTFQAHHHAFALPQIGFIESKTAKGTDDLLWSTISLDRPKRSIVMTEYRAAKEGESFPAGTTRAVRFPFAKDSTHFAKTTTASEALAVPIHYLNGVASHNGRWWFNSSRYKTLSYWPGSGPLHVHEEWVSYGESLSYWENEDGPDLLWSLQEGVGHRTVFAVEQADFAG